MANSLNIRFLKSLLAQGNNMFKIRSLQYKDFIKYKDIDILKHKINFIKGESGCGKSTLLKLLNKIEDFSGGEIFYKDKALAEYESIALRKEVKLISQNPFLFSGTIKDNFKLFYDYCDEKLITIEKMKYFLSLLEANFDLESECDKLSGGEKQRVYIAICLSMEAETIMLDEASSALDSKNANKVFENIISYVKENNKTLIAISHDDALVNKFAENIIDLNGVKTNE